MIDNLLVIISNKLYDTINEILIWLQIHTSWSLILRLPSRNLLEGRAIVADVIELAHEQLSPIHNAVKVSKLNIITDILCEFHPCKVVVHHHNDRGDCQRGGLEITINTNLELCDDELWIQIH